MAEDVDEGVVVQAQHGIGRVRERRAVALSAPYPSQHMRVEGRQSGGHPLPHVAMAAAVR
ncbi:hypothetical protein ABZW47_29350 [Streptomyces sp. NPDC004549]|uniref:hypothetical protein n=1 Tax=Streptomyces sp. NPDC004549 TaxID=3154283 RepID=UPI0033A6F70E